MSQLILPPIALYNQERERLAERHGALRWFDQQLKELDPRLELVKATETARAPDMIPGYWHVKRNNEPPAQDTYMAIKGDHGEFIEPHSGILDQLRRDDAWNNGGFDALKKAWAERERRRENARLLAHEERVAEIATRVKAKDNPGVSFGTKGWTYRAGARKA